MSGIENSVNDSESMRSGEDKKQFYRQRKGWIELAGLIDIILMAVPFGIIWGFYYSKQLPNPFFYKGIWAVILVYIILYYSFAKTYAAFHINTARISDIVYSQFLTVLFTNIVMFMVIFLLMRGMPPILPMLAIIGMQLIIAVIWSFLSHSMYFKNTPPANTVIVETDQREPFKGIIESYGLVSRFNVTKSISAEKCINSLDESLNGAQVVFLVDLHSHDRNTILKYCITHSIRVYMIPSIGDLIMRGAESMHMFHLPVYLVERHNPSAVYLFIKRLVDIVASLIGLIILSPLMCIVALLIKRDGGTAFYKQTRLTKNGKKFEVLKFRSMRMDAEKDGVARLSTGEEDDRITPIGRFIRSCRIDELPQLINILNGDMSIVGNSLVLGVT